MNFKPSAEDEGANPSQEPEADDSILNIIPASNSSETTAESKTTTDDLFSAHDFDIKIDLEVPLPSAPVSVTVTAQSGGNREPGPRRSLNLQDYKKKRGLI